MTAADILTDADEHMELAVEYAKEEFAKDPKKSVAQVLKEAGATATNFARFKVGV